jgi:hypothetical protein
MEFGTEDHSLLLSWWSYIKRFVSRYKFEASNVNKEKLKQIMTRYIPKLENTILWIVFKKKNIKLLQIMDKENVLMNWLLWYELQPHWDFRAQKNLQKL